MKTTNNTNELPVVLNIPISLTVAHVGFGGNSGPKKEFFYAFNQEVIILKDINTKVIISLSDATHKDFSIEQIIFSNVQNVLIKEDNNNSKRTICFKNISLNPCSIEVSILCSYKKGDLVVHFNCDPQVINDPVAD